MAEPQDTAVTSTCRVRRRDLELEGPGYVRSGTHAMAPKPPPLPATPPGPFGDLSRTSIEEITKLAAQPPAPVEEARTVSVDGREFVRDLRAQAVALFSHHKQEANVNALLAQSFGSRNLRRDDALGVARPAPVNVSRIFRRGDERRHRIHVRGKYHRGLRMLLFSRIDVEAGAFYVHLLRPIAQTAQFAVEIISHCSFVAGNRLDVHQLPRQRYSVHERENSRQDPNCGPCTRTSDLGRQTSAPRPAPFLFPHPSRVI